MTASPATANMPPTGPSPDLITGHETNKIITLVFASQWKFNASGLTSVKKAFTYELKKRNLPVSFEYIEDEHLFVIRCSQKASNLVAMLFGVVMKQLIKVEGNLTLEEDLDSCGSNDSSDDEASFDEINVTLKVERLPLSAVRDAEVIDMIGDSADINISQVPEAIRALGIRTMWHCPESKHTLDEIIPDIIIEELSNLTGCTFIKDSDKQAIFIGSESEESAISACVKLDVIRENWVFESKIFMSHLFYTETVVDAHVAPILFSDYHKRMVETTLLDNLQLSAVCNYSTLSQTFGIRCSSYDTLKAQYTLSKLAKLIPAISPHSRDMEMRFWKSYVYLSKGSRFNDPMRHFNEDLVLNEPQINDPNRNSVIYARGRTGFSSPTSDIYRNSPPFKNKALRIRNPEFSEEPESLAEFPKSRKEDTLLDIGNHETTSYLDFPIASVTASQYEGCVDVEADVLQFEDEVVTRKFHSTMKQQSGNYFLGFKNSNVTQDPLNGPLFKGLLHANTLALLPDPLPQLKESICTGFERMLEKLMRFRGELSVEAVIGRVLLTNLPSEVLSIGDNLKTVTQDLLSEVLQQQGFRSKFTSVVTTIPSDIHFLTDMKDNNEESIWSPEPIKQKVLYEIICYNRMNPDSPPFSVEIDAESFEMEMKLRRQLGSMFIHGTKRRWDFRIAALGYESYPKHDKTAWDLARTIHKTLYIPCDQQVPFLFFEAKNYQVDRFEINAVRVHRSSSFESRDGASILKINQLHDLDVDLAPVHSKDISVLRAYGGNEHRAPAEKLNMWYEISISSKKASKAFEKNKNLELGELADYSTDALNDYDGITAIYGPALDMIKRMDGIGFYNDNGATTAPDETQWLDQDDGVDLPSLLYW